MRIEHIVYVLEAARCESISKAAKNLFIGQPTMSMAINAIENELHGEIFYRTNKGIKLTSYGERVLPELESIIEHHQRLRHFSTTSHQAENAKNVHVASYWAGSIAVIPQVVAQMRQAFPDSSLHISDISPESVIKHLVANGRNIGLEALTRPKFELMQVEAKNYGFICRELYEDSIAAYVHRENPYACQDKLSLQSLKESPIAILHSFILPSDNYYYQNFHMFAHVYSFSSYDSLKRTIIEQKMLAIAPDLAFYHDPYCQEGELVRKDIEDLQGLVNFVVYPQDEKKLSSGEMLILKTIEAFFERYRRTHCIMNKD